MSQAAITIRDLILKGVTLEQICTRTNRDGKNLMRIMSNNNGMDLVFVKREKTA